jgi:hypothetical protein
MMDPPDDAIKTATAGLMGSVVICPHACKSDQAASHGISERKPLAILMCSKREALWTTVAPAA